MDFKKIIPYCQLMRLDKPVGFFLLLWPTLIALWLAGEGKPNLSMVIIFVLGVLIMRSAGCVVNDIVDRKFDGFVKRTQSRPLATGVISLKSAILLTLILFGFALLLVLQLNALTIKLSIIAVLITLFYPWMKRYTHFAQVVLGAAFGMAVPMAFSAISNTIPSTAWVLYVAVLIWTVAFDTEYAMADKEDDAKLKLKSTARLLGKHDRSVIFLLQIGMCLLLMRLGFEYKLGVFYYFGFIFVLFFILYQQYLIKDRVPSKCFLAFSNNQYLGAFLYFMIVIALLLR